MKKFYLKKVLAAIITIFFVFLLVIYPKIAVSSAYKGLRLWSDIVFPSLMPFFVCSEILNKLNFPRKISMYFEPIMRPLFNVPGSAAYPFVMGITSGYPVGAKIVCDMRANNILSKKEGERLLSFCNNSGPLFIIGAVSTGMLNLSELGIVLVLINIASAVTVGIVLNLCTRKSKSNYDYKNSPYPTEKNMKKMIPNVKYKQKYAYTLSCVFGEAISESVELQLKICGFIVIFSVIINLLLKTGLLKFIFQPLIGLIASFTGKIELIESLTEYICCGLFEITTGISLISNLNTITLLAKICIIMMLIGWAGISVHSQVASIVKNTDMSLKIYYIGKSLQGIISAVYTFLYFKVINTKAVLMIEDAFSNLHNVFAISTNGVQNSINYFSVSSLILFYSLFMLLMYCLAINIYKNKASRK